MTERRQFCPKGHDTFKFGRDSSYRCLQCKKEAGRAARYLRITEDRGIREAERQRRDEEEQAAREAEHRRWQEEADRRREREYQRALKAGGDVAAEARWWRLDSETYDAYGGRYSLCQWATESGGLGGCFRRTTGDVYCWRHERESERETKRKKPSST